MADFSVSITVPNEKRSELVEALRWHWGPNEDDSEKSVSELRAALKTSVESSLRDIFIRHKRYLRDQQEIDGSLELE